MPQLTRIENASSQAVRAQYETNPYPRWTKIAPLGRPKSVDQYLRERFALAPFRPLGDLRAWMHIQICHCSVPRGRNTNR